MPQQRRQSSFCFDSSATRQGRRERWIPLSSEESDFRPRGFPSGPGGGEPALESGRTPLGDARPPQATDGTLDQGGRAAS